MLHLYSSSRADHKMLFFCLHFHLFSCFLIHDIIPTLGGLGVLDITLQQSSLYFRWAQLHPFFARVLQPPLEDTNRSTAISFSPFTASLQFPNQAGLQRPVSIRTFRHACTTAYTSNIASSNWKFFLVAIADSSSTKRYLQVYH